MMNKEMVMNTIKAIEKYIDAMEATYGKYMVLHDYVEDEFTDTIWKTVEEMYAKHKELCTAINIKRTKEYTKEDLVNGIFEETWMTVEE